MSLAKVFIFLLHLILILFLMVFIFMVFKWLNSIHVTKLLRVLLLIVLSPLSHSKNSKKAVTLTISWLNFLFKLVRSVSNPLNLCHKIKVLMATFLISMISRLRRIKLRFSMTSSLIYQVMYVASLVMISTLLCLLYLTLIALMN
ncbi:MAG: hypothetical protein [Microviridae sp.]|nr:MAG: hypothetical protein [Microviridae sp.]